jgi:hypothetical protein
MRSTVSLFVLALFVLAIVCCTSNLYAQDGYFANWFARVDKAKDEQPHWVTPLATTTPRLEEEYRYDQVWQTNGKGITTDNYDGGKGLELIPFEKVEVIFNLPPYIDHNSPSVRNGWGDAAFLVKYRLLSANEEHGSYILTAFLGWGVPTGQYSNGALHAVITPTIAYGKGFGNFDVQGTFGVALPVADTNLVGRSYLFNNTFQYKGFAQVLAGDRAQFNDLSRWQERWHETELRDSRAGHGTFPFVRKGGLYRWRWIPDRDNSLPYE